MLLKVMSPALSGTLKAVQNIFSVSLQQHIYNLIKLPIDFMHTFDYRTTK